MPRLHDLTDDIALGHRLADAAGAEIRKHFRSLGGVERKGDASPVTVADRDAEAAMRAMLDRERSADGIIGEEYGEERTAAARVWVLDPIDGTRSFVAGRPLFGTLIALLVDGVPVLGVIDQCIGGDRWVGAAGQATTLGGAPARTRSCAALAAAHLATSSPHYFTGDGLAAFARVRAGAGDTLYGGDCYNYGLVASGHLDVVIESGLKIYDWAALVPVVAGAGGVMTDWAGAPLRPGSDGAVVAAGDARVHAEALRLLAG